MMWLVISDPEIQGGTPLFAGTRVPLKKLVCFRGTRIPLSVVLDNLAGGETSERILNQYPSLKREHIPAAVGYAAELARERIIPIPA